MSPRKKPQKTFAELVDEFCAKMVEKTGETYGVRDLAMAAGVGHSTIYYIMNGETDPKHVTVVNIAKGMKLAVSVVKAAIDETFREEE